MTRCIVEKKNDFSVRKYELPVKTCQYSFHYFRCRPILIRIRKKVNISWALQILQFLKTAWGFTLPDDNGLVDLYPSCTNKKSDS